MGCPHASCALLAASPARASSLHGQPCFRVCRDPAEELRADKAAPLRPALQLIRPSPVLTRLKQAVASLRFSLQRVWSCHTDRMDVCRVRQCSVDASRTSNAPHWTSPLVAQGAMRSHLVLTLADCSTPSCWPCSGIKFLTLSLSPRPSPLPPLPFPFSPGALLARSMLAHNHFSGEIPAAWGSLSSLVSL